MSDQFVVGSPRARSHRAPRRWPSILVAIGLASVLALMGLLVFQDRQNADAASSARSNAARDAVAYAGLQSFSHAAEVAGALESEGVLGLQQIGTTDFESEVVAPLGGSIETTPFQWTLALGGGWACMSWPQGSGPYVLSVTRGVCGGSPIVRTRVVTTEQLAAAMARSLHQQQAAYDAAFALSIPHADAGQPRTVATLADRFRELGRTDFSTHLTHGGVTVTSRASTACVRPISTDELVRVALGPCS